MSAAQSSTEQHSLEEGRIARTFARLKAQGRTGFVPFITAGDPDGATSAALMKALPGAGADLIELGVPFTDPMADGPAIQEASLRALKAGASLAGTLELVEQFRRHDPDTPIVLMGYFNPVHAYGRDRFLGDAKTAGVDGLIMVDLPPEEDEALCIPAREAGIDFVRLATPTTGPERLRRLLTQASGFLYYVTITGVTGTASAAQDSLEQAVAKLKAATDLPVGVGFGIRTPEQAAAAAGFADAVIVGSAIVNRIKARLADHDGAGAIGEGLRREIVDDVAGFAATLARACHEGVAG